jgi:Deacetylases, including yeast histone deacetylase and acetoin utilization protein
MCSGTGHSYELGKGAGRGWSLNVPLEPFSGDASYLEVFDILVPDAIAAFEPDVIVLQAGADTHTLDPLADLSLSLHGMRASYERVVELADSFAGGRLLVTGGGGYAAFQVPPRAWAHAWSVMTGRRLPISSPSLARALARARRGGDADVPSTPRPIRYRRHDGTRYEPQRGDGEAAARAARTSVVHDCQRLLGAAKDDT